MTSEELTTWFSDELWIQYAGLVKTPFATKWKSGTKGEALKKILTLKPSVELRERILMAIAAQKKHRQNLFEFCGSMQSYLERTAYDKFYANRMCSTWLNQLGYEDEIPSLTMENVAVEKFASTCTFEGCDNPIHGPRFLYCATHLVTDNTDDLKQKLRSLGMGKSKDETKQEYLTRCRARFTELYGSLGFKS